MRRESGRQVWANLAGGSYESVWQTEVPVGPAWLHLDPTLSGWVTDGLLAVFFFVAGLEVKRVLVVGGILGGAWLAVRAGLGRLPDGVGWADLLPVAVLGGIGYTVSLLVTELAIEDAAARQHAATAVLAASLVAAAVAVVLLRRRGRQVQV